MKTKEEENLGSKIVIPGLTDKKSDGDKENTNPPKKLMMQEMSSKYTPNYKINHINEDGQDKI
jgi:hypothetical protein